MKIDLNRMKIPTVNQFFKIAVQDFQKYLL